MAKESLNINYEEHCRKDCKFYKKGSIFEECQTEESQYHDNNAKLQHHTISHMRSKGECGKDARLYRRKY